MYCCSHPCIVGADGLYDLASCTFKTMLMKAKLLKAKVLAVAGPKIPDTCSGAHAGFLLDTDLNLGHNTHCYKRIVCTCSNIILLSKMTRKCGN